MIPAHNCFPFSPIFMKLHAKTPHEWRMSYWFWGQRSRSQCIDNWKWLCCIIAFPLHLLSWNFIQRLPMSRGCALFISGLRCQRSRLQCIDTCNWKWFMSYNCFPSTPVIIKLHTKTPLESRICPMDFGSKGKRSRSQCIDNWKWFLLHNCFPFTPIIMKLHTKTCHELRMCRIDFGLKRSKVKYWKWLMLHNCFPFTPIIMKLCTKTPHESRMCPLDFRIKVKVTMHWFLKRFFAIFSLYS